MLNFGDELCSRRRFKPENSIFWRRALFSSLFCTKNPLLYRRNIPAVFNIRNSNKNENNGERPLPTSLYAAHKAVHLIS